MVPNEEKPDGSTSDVDGQATTTDAEKAEADEVAVAEAAPAPDADVVAAPAEPVPAEAETALSDEPTTVDAGAPGAVPADPAVTPAIPVAGASRVPLIAVSAVAVLLLVATVVLGTLLVGERSAHDDASRDLRAEKGHSAQLAADLADAQAKRTDLETKLAAAEAAKLSPEAKTAITTCVTLYAGLEKALQDAINNNPPPAGSTVEYRPIVGGPNTAGISNVCVEAQKYLA